MANRTTFKKNEETGEWAWHTQSANGDITGDAGGYDNWVSAVNGYFSQQGFPNWQPGDKLPEGYAAESLIGGDQFVITQET